MKVRYQYRLFFYFAIVLVIVVAGFSIFIMKRERAQPEGNAERTYLL